MRGALWFVLISLPVAMFVALGLFLIVIAVCARAIPASPFDEIIGLAMAAAMVRDSKPEFVEALARLQGPLIAWMTPIGAVGCLIGGLAGGALSRDMHRSWFALVPVLMVWVMPLRQAPWTVLVLLLWVAAAVGGAMAVRRRVDSSAQARYTSNVNEHTKKLSTAVALRAGPPDSV